MNTSNLIILAALLSAEVLLVIGCTALTERAINSGHWRQRIWQACFVCLGLLTLAEWFGARDLLGLRRTSEPVLRSVSITSATLAMEPTAAIALPASPAVEPAPTIVTGDQPPTVSPSPSVSVKKTSVNPLPWLVLIYPIIAALLALALWASHFFLFRLSSLCRRITDVSLLAQIEGMRAALGLSRAVRLLESDRVRGPLACGLFRPSIILPVAFAKEFEPAQQRVMLVHELAHLANRDPVWHLLTDLITICFWFHPAVWWARSRMQSAGEAAADEASLLVSNGPETLAECLVTLGARLMQKPATAGFSIAGWRFKSNLGRRVARLLHFKDHAWAPPSPTRTLCLRALAPISLVLVTLWGSVWIAPAAPPLLQPTKVIASDVESPQIRLVVVDERATQFTEVAIPASEAQTSIENLIVAKVQTTTSEATAAEPEKIEPALETQWFKIDLSNTARAIKAMVVIDSSTDQNAAKATETEADQSPLERDVELLRTFLKATGIELTSPKTIMYNDQLRALVVRATREDLRAIEKSLQILNAAPQQLTIEVRWCERRMDQPWPQGFAVQNDESTNVTLRGILTPAQSQVFINALLKQPGVDLLTAPRVTTLSGRQAQIKVVEVRHIVTDLYVSTNQVRNADGNMQSGALLPITKPYELGPVLDIVPTVRADALSIDLTVTGTLKEFIGYDTHAPEILEPSVPRKSLLAQAGYDQEDGKENNPQVQVPRRPLGTRTPLPVFRLRQIASAASVYDGQTLVLGGGLASFETKMKDKVPFLGDIPLAGRLFRSEHKETVKKELLLLITPRLIDPAGNVIHTEEDLAKKTDGHVPESQAK